MDIEDCNGVFINPPNCSGCPLMDSANEPCPRSSSRNVSACRNNKVYDVVIVGAGCIGAAIARELSRYSVSILWVEAADDVSQGATKGNSGIVHAGYDDTPGSNRAKYCWNGNQMFAQLDKELRFGYQTNGSLVLAFTPQEKEHLYELKQRGETNGVQRLKIVEKDELHEMEPYVNPEAIAALYSPDAGNVIPYEFTIALAENAVDNGVELYLRRKVTSLSFSDIDASWTVTLRHWEPHEHIKATTQWTPARIALCAIVAVSGCISTSMGMQVVLSDDVNDWTRFHASVMTYAMILLSSIFAFHKFTACPSISRSTPMTKLVRQATPPVGHGGTKVQVDDMLVGGSGSSAIVHGATVDIEEIKARYVINCAGGASDTIARMIGDDSFTIKPRLGDYLLLNRNQVRT